MILKLQKPNLYSQDEEEFIDLFGLELELNVLIYNGSLEQLTNHYDSIRGYYLAYEQEDWDNFHNFINLNFCL
jgi:hypothetical protein